MKPYVLHLLRHGEPVIAGRMLGRTDCAPTAAGIEACMDQVRGLDINAVVSSDLSRARLAAEAVGAILALPVQIDPRWRELDFGEWDGLAAGEIDQAGLGRLWEDPDANPPPGGESWSDLVERVGTALAKTNYGTTLIVTHGGAMRAALAHLCGFEQSQLWAFDLPYAALLSLKIWPGEPPSAQITGLRP